MGDRTRHLGLFAAVVMAVGLLAACAPEPAPPGTTTVPDDPNGHYVATTGEDTGTCSASADPCLTIGYATSQADPGDTVYVAAGTYPEVVVPDRDITYKGANAGVPAGTEPGTRGAESVVKGFRTPGNPGTASYSITIDGFRIEPQGDAALISATLQPLVWLRGGTSTVVQNNVFNGGDFVPDCTYTCTTMTDSAFIVQSGGVTFTANTVENFRRPVQINQALGAPATSAVVSNNSFTGVTSRALALAGATGVQMAGQTVTGNSFDATGRTAPSSPAGITVSNGGNSITGNTFTALSSGVYVDLCKKFITNDNQITGNDFLGNGGGVNISVNTDGGQCVSSATEGSGGWVVGAGRINGMVISDNNFSGNSSYAIRHAAFNWGFFTAAAPLSSGIDATCNHYGSEDAPAYAEYSYPPGTIAPNPDGIIGTAAPEAPIDFTPWRTAPAPAGACDGGL